MTLEKQWHDAKTAEDYAKQERLRIEKLILEQHQKSWESSDKNTHHLETITITTGENRKWDAKGVGSMKAKLEVFPFTEKVEYKENKELTAILRATEPELYQELEQYLTIVPKKPYFKGRK